MFVRSTFDKAVCSEPLAFAADAGLWVLNGRNALQRVWKKSREIERRCEAGHRCTQYADCGCGERILNRISQAEGTLPVGMSMRACNEVRSECAFKTCQ
jgi:hypothetical protein